MVYESQRKLNPRTKHKAGQENNMRYSHEDLATAMAKFEEEGGLPRKLPEQITPVSRMVLPRNFRNSSAYEMVYVVGIEGE